MEKSKIPYSSVSEAIKNSNTTALFAGGTIKKAQKILNPNEGILGAVCGSLHKAVGIMVLTTQRVFVYSYQLGDTIFEEIRLNDIKSVNLDKPPLQKATITITGSLIRIGITFSRSAADDFYNAIMAAKNNAIRPNNSHSQSSSKLNQDDIEILKQLGDLYQSGVITKEEFETKKRQILGI